MQGVYTSGGDNDVTYYLQ